MRKPRTVEVQGYCHNAPTHLHCRYGRHIANEYENGPRVDVHLVRGVVRAIGETSWTVGETKVVVNAKTKIPEKLAVGDTAIVAGVK
ncbi:MAG: DUF5666 domain-containing protein, partial [Thermoanaerobaculia bacterium]